MKEMRTPPPPPLPPPPTPPPPPTTTPLQHVIACRLQRLYDALGSRGSSAPGDNVGVSFIAHTSLVHAVVLGRNSDTGVGSLAPLGARHGAATAETAKMSISPRRALCCVPSNVVADVATILFRYIAAANDGALSGVHDAL
jgi:hypothetical protein